MPKKNMPPPLSDGQLEIMEVVWDGGEVTVNDVWRKLQERREIARTTVQTIMLRLDKRGWLEHCSQGKTFFYSAAHPRDASQRQIVQRLVDTAFRGSVDGLVMTLLEERGISDEQAEPIREMIAEAEKKARKKGGRR